MNKETLQEYNTRLAENNTSLDDVLATINNLPERGTGGGSSLEIYSTEETVIGTWIDGKPLYRKVIETSSINLKGEYKLVELDTSCIVRFLSCTFVSPYGQFILGSDTSEINHKGSNIIVKTNIDWGNGNIVIIVEYTKTTD